MSTAARLNRLFGPGGRCFQIALDHGVHNEWRFLSGVENIREVVGVAVKADPDAILLSPGQAMVLQGLPGRRKPALALRTDPTNLYGSADSRHYFCQMIARPVEQALRLDAACVVANLLFVPEEPELYHQCLKNLCRLKPECERYGMPLMVEPLGYKRTSTYVADRSIPTIAALVRQAVELGADIIKADPPDDMDQYERVIEVASDRPVLPRGGERVSDEELLKRTERLLERGARGVVYGRNVFQHPDPARIGKAIRAMIDEGRSAEEAIGSLG